MATMFNIYVRGDLIRQMHPFQQNDTPSFKLGLTKNYDGKLRYHSKYTKVPFLHVKYFHTSNYL